MTTVVCGTAKCECGVRLPAHLADLSLTAHVCSCTRRYKIVGGSFVRDGVEYNPFAIGAHDK